MSAETIFRAWNRSRAWLLPALEDGAARHGDAWTEDEVINELVCGRAQLWAGDDAAAVTFCRSDPPRMHIWLAGGRMRDVMGLLPGAIGWARSMGLGEVTCLGRPGWSRVLRGLGFEGADVLRRVIA